MATEKIKAIVVGAAGRMGRRVLSALQENPHFLLVGAVERSDHPQIGQDIGEITGQGKWQIALANSLEKVIKEGEVIIDFTNAEASLNNLKVAGAAGRAAVIGSTGFTPAQMNEVKEITRKIPCVLSPNMSVGVNVVFRLIAELAQVLGDEYDVEIIEAHHRLKKDAPSGTALKMGQILAQALKRNFEEVGVYARHGIIGERRKEEIGLQTIRAGDIVGEHTIIFGGMGERIEIIHRAHSRDNFARGALRAAQWVVKQQPGLYDMQDVLGLK